MNPFLQTVATTFIYHDGPNDPRSRAIIYIRVSQAKKDMVSPEQQDTVCRNFAAMHNFEIVGDNVEDIDISGRSFEKRKVAELIERVRAGEFGTILVWQYSRWARNAGMGLAHIKLLESVGGQLIAVTEIADTRTPSGILQQGIMLQFAEHYSNLQGAGWKQTHAMRILSGRPANGLVRFGYKRCPSCRRKEDRPEAYYHCKECEGVLVIDPLRGPWLADAYEAFNSGKPTTALVNESYRLGIHSTKDRLLSPKTMLGILDSGFGAGLICVDPRPRPEGKTLTPDITKYLWYPGIHEPLIDNVTWQNFMDRRSEQKTTNPKTIYARNSHAMSGIFRCSRILPNGEMCLGSVKANHIENGESFFRCSNSITFKTCDASRVPESTLMKFVKEWVMVGARDEGVALGAMRRMAKRKEMQTSIAAYDEAKKLAEERLKRLQDIYLANDVSREYYIDKKAILESEIQALENQIKEAGGAMNREMPAPAEFEGLLKVWDRVPRAELNAALKKLISYGLVQGGGGGRRGGLWSPYKMEIIARWEAPPIDLRQRNPGNLPGAQFVNLPKRVYKKPDQ